MPNTRSAAYRQPHLSLARRTLVCTAVALTASWLPLAVQAQTDAFPSKPVRFVVPFPPASATDVIARALGQKLGERWGQSVVIDNKPGAGGNLGTEQAVKTPADGHTVLFGTVANAISASLYTKLNYNFVRDFDPVTLIAKTPLVLVANASVPASNVGQLIELAKGSSDKLAFGSGGVGTSNHLAGEMFNGLTGVGMLHVPYKGTPAAYTDLLGGRISVMFDNIVAAMPQIKSGQLKPLAVTSARRSAVLPAVPTIAESGLTGFEAVSWIGVLVPKGTPASVIDRLNQDFTAVMAMPDVQQRLAATGAELSPGSPAEFALFIRNEIAKWEKAVKTSGARAD